MALNLYGEGLTIEKTAGQLMFDGFHDPLVALAFNVPTYLEFLFKEINPFDRIGWFYGRNNTSLFSGHTTSGTSASKKNLEKMVLQNFSNRTSAYAGTCAEVEGFTGQMYGQNLNREDPISFFIPDMCRDLSLDFETDKEIDGISGFKYVAGPRNFANVSVYPENVCYHQKDDLMYEEMPSGLFSLGPCHFNFPVYVSYPHFYSADPSYLESVDGLRPQQESHQFYVVVNPVRLASKSRKKVNFF